MTITLEELLEGGIAHATRILITERHKELQPFFHLVLPNDEMALVPVKWANETEKQIVLAGVRHVAKELGATMALTLSEAWAVEAPDNIKTVEAGRECMKRQDPPSESPRRKEIVIICATDGERTIGKSLSIERNKHTRKIDRLVESGGALAGVHFEGRLIDVLPRKRQSARGEGERP